VNSNLNFGEKILKTERNYDKWIDTPNETEQNRTKSNKDLPYRRCQRRRCVSPVADLVPATAILLEAPNAAALLSTITGLAANLVTTIAALLEASNDVVLLPSSALGSASWAAGPGRLEHGGD
jgi:hypothetical protein